MKKINRIRKNEEFSQIIAEKHSCASACFVIYYSNAKLEECRVGISVSKKLGNAVVRNKIKRQVREMAYKIIDFKNDHKDLIIIVRSNFLNNDFVSNLNDLEKAIKKAII